MKYLKSELLEDVLLLFFFLDMTALEVKNGSWTPVLKDSFMIQVQKGQPVYQIDTSGSKFILKYITYINPFLTDLFVIFFCSFNSR